MVNRYFYHKSFKPENKVETKRYFVVINQNTNENEKYFHKSSRSYIHGGLNLKLLSLKVKSKKILLCYYVQ